MKSTALSLTFLMPTKLCFSKITATTFLHQVDYYILSLASTTEFSNEL